MSIVNVFVVNIAVMVAMADSAGVSAIAWGTLISSISNTAMLVIYASVKYDLKLGGGVNKKELLKPIIPFIALTFIMYISSKYFLFDYKWINFIVGVTIFGVSTIILYVMFQIKEIEQFYTKLKSKLVKTN